MVRSARSIPEGPFSRLVIDQRHLSTLQLSWEGPFFFGEDIYHQPGSPSEFGREESPEPYCRSYKQGIILDHQRHCAYLSGRGRSSFLGLKRYKRLLPRLHTLGIQPRTPESTILHVLNSKKLGSHAFPETLADLLTRIGVDLETIRTCLLYRNDKDPRQEQIACLHDHVYPFLRILADTKAKTKA